MLPKDQDVKKFKESYQVYQKKVTTLKKEGNQLLKEMEQALSEVKAQQMLHKVGQKYKDNN